MQFCTDETQVAVPRITIFTIPKPFTGLAAIHQHNAIGSWVRLAEAEVVLCGDEAGVADAARAHGVQHAPGITLNAYGTPLVNSAFGVVSQMANGSVLCYVNADIVLLSDFAAALNALSLRQFLVCGQRCDLDMPAPMQFDTPRWESDLMTRARATGVLHAVDAMDYFVFPRGLFSHIPPFTVGRAMWDNWLMFHARSSRVPVVDATAAVTAVHQNHDYGHIQGGIQAVWHGAEAKLNRALAADMLYPFTIADADFELTQNGHCRRRTMIAAARLAMSEVALAVRAHPRIRQFIRTALRAHGT